MPTVVLFVFMLMFMLMRVYLPIGARVKGKTVKTVPLSLLERFHLQRVNLYAIAVFLFVAVVSGEIDTSGLVLMMVAAQAVTALPVRCVMTTEGIALNKVVFRPWSDFTGFTAESHRLVLSGQDGTRPFKIPFFAEHQKEVLPALRRYLPETKARKEAPRATTATAG